MKSQVLHTINHAYQVHGYIYVVCGVVVWIFRYLVVNGGSFHVFAVLCKLYL